MDTVYGAQSYANRGDRTSGKAVPRQRADPCADECAPPCPACGGLQCLCRPRFFPGQLLTDEDLNRLENYVVEKNRLHNRYLVGWGVACGLEVVCDGCDPDHVIVRTGYALSPCGDDIIVCRDSAVNICELIQRCRAPTDQDCDPRQPRPPRDCRGGRDQWVLAICYDERPSRGVTALLGSSDTACCSNCACGGSGSCSCKSGGCATCGGTGTGCGCAGASSNSKTAAGTGAKAGKPRSKYAPQCEPTQICEGYHFIAYPAPKPQKGLIDGLSAEDIRKQYGQGLTQEMLWAWLYANRARFGPLLERVICCVMRAMELRGTIREGKALNVLQGIQVYSDYASALREFAADFAIHRCAFVSRTQLQYDDAIRWSANARVLGQFSAGVQADLAHRVGELDVTWLNILAECFCSALLPACPEPATKNCVPLAVITVGGNPCRVAEICNWEERKLLITWRTILYWLSWLPWHLLREWIARLCCGDTRDREIVQWLTMMIGVAFAGMQTSAQTKSKAMPMTIAAPAPAAAVVAGLSVPAGAGTSAGGAGAAPSSDLVADAMNADNLLAHLVSSFARIRSGEDAQAPQWAALAARFTDGSALAPLAGRAGGGEAVDALRVRVDALAKKVAAQQKTIAALKRG